MRTFSVILAIISALALSVNAAAPPPSSIDRSISPAAQLCINDIIYSTSWMDTYSARVLQYYSDPSLPKDWYAMLDLSNKYYFNGTKPALEAQAADCAKVQLTVSTEIADSTVAALTNLIASIEVAFKNVVSQYPLFAAHTLWTDRFFRDELINYWKLTNQTTSSTVSFTPANYATGLNSAIGKLYKDLLAATDKLRPIVKPTATTLPSPSST